MEHISIHALREEGDVQHHANVFDLAISIHALREEGDRPGRIRHGPAGCISIHALREEGDQLRPASMRRCCSYFYPRPPRGGRLEQASSLMML